MISFVEITDAANPEGVSEFVHSMHPWCHKLATAVGTSHSMFLASR